MRRIGTLLCVALVLALCPVTVCSSNCSLVSQSSARYTVEDSALRALYESAGGSGWDQTKYGRWLNASYNHCEWQGVSCDCNASGSGSGVTDLNFMFGPLSGELSPALSSLTGLKHMLMEGNTQLRGTIPAQYLNLTNLNTILVSLTQLSGTLPLLASSIEHVACSLTKLSGTIAHDWKRRTGLQTLQADYSAIEVNLELLWHWPNMRHVTLTSTATKGVVPANMLARSPLLQSLLVSSNALQGTLADNLFRNATNLRFLDLSLQHHMALSGTLPSSMTNLTALDSFAANNLKVSGTIPGSALVKKGQPVWPLLRLFVTTRLFLGGTADVFALCPLLETLILGNNRMSCQMPSLDQAPNLGAHLFRQPNLYVASEIGELLLANGAVPVNYWAGWRALVGTFRSQYQAFNANRFTTSASYVPLSRSPASLTRDFLRQGQHGLFSGDTDFKFATGVFMPVSVLSLVAAVLWTSKKAGQPMAAGLKRFCKLPNIRDEAGRHIYMHSLQHTFLPFCGLSFLGVCMLVLYLTSSSLYTCQDPFLRTTISGLDMQNSTREWCWLLLTMCMQSLPLWYFMVIKSDRRERCAKSALRIMMTVFFCTRRDAVHRWKRKVFTKRFLQQHHWKERYLRRGLYVMAIAFFSAVFALPTFVFILSVNIPTGGSSWIWKVVGNSTAIALVKMTINQVIVPPLTQRLAKLMGGSPQVRGLDRARYNIRLNGWAVNAAFALRTLSTDLSAIIATVLLDETCLRYWLLFSPSIAKLVEAFNLKMTGYHAYRENTCARTIVYLYAYVWLTTIFAEMMIFPAIKLVREDSRFRVLIARLQKRFTAGDDSDSDTNADPLAGDKEFKVAQQESELMQFELVSLQSQTLTVFLFSPMVPVFAIIAPISIMVQLVVRQWVDAPSEHWVTSWASGRSVGRQLARTVLVHIPRRTLQIWLLGCTWGFTVFLLVDLKFTLGSLVTYLCFIAVQLVLVVFMHFVRLKFGFLDSLRFFSGGLLSTHKGEHLDGLETQDIEAAQLPSIQCNQLYEADHAVKTRIDTINTLTDALEAQPSTVARSPRALLKIELLAMKQRCKDGLITVFSKDFSSFSGLS
eukprot:TRINITY_DN2756_c0_g1_i12.p1 TRINITY_DN2756_c0_g1~~TRINITY_DN2756_c0_g1_i12.p1  ORF type:complete len:1090 (+),score=311.24 TRINITY_DN2756_c0_g1_i12:218-3487(+)